MTPNFLQRFGRNLPAVLGFAVIAAVVGIALLAPWIVPGNPWDIAGPPYLAPGEEAAFPLGTDVLGRNILTGLLHGAWVSLVIGLAATLAAVVVGAAVGATAGFLGGWIDDALMRFTEIFQTIPPFLFAIVIVAIFKPSVGIITAAIAAISWPGVARLMRGEALRLRNAEFVLSCHAIGMSNVRIITTQILPNCAPALIVSASVMVATAILTEAGLAFLGLGDPNRMSWGTMIGIGREALRTDWHMCGIPGIAIIVTVLGFNLLGDGLNDALNPRLAQD